MSKKIIYKIELDYMSSLMGYYNLLEIVGTENYNDDTAEAYEYYMNLWDERMNTPEMLFVKNDLKMIVKSETFFFMIVDILKANTVEALINMSNSEFYEKAVVILEKSNELSSDELYKEISETLEGNYNTCDEDFMILKELVFNTRAFKERLNDALKKTYRIFTEEIFTVENQEKVQKELTKFQAMLDEDESEFLNNITLLNTPERDFIPEELNIYMLYFAPYSYTFMMRSITLMFGRKMPEEIKKRNDKLNIESFLKILADPNRYKMIKLLSNKAFYGAELAKELGLSTATISHHMDKIHNLKLTNAIKGENNKLYIQLNKIDLESYLEELKADLLG